MVESGAHRLPVTHENIGLFLAHYRHWLVEAIKRLQPAEILFEMPVLPGRDQTNIMTLRKLYSLCGITALVAHDHSIVCGERNISRVRSAALGKGNVPKKSDAAKKAIIAWCFTRGWTPETDDEADALALLDLRLGEQDPVHSLNATPLFGSRGNA